MDVDNDIQQWTQLLTRQKKTLQEAKKRQGQRPHDRKPRDLVYQKFMMTLILASNKFKDERHMVHSSFIPSAYPPCITPLTDLQRILIQDLRLETHHRGTYLLLRSITLPNRMTAIMAVIEDEDRDVVILQLYQQDDEGVRAAKEIIPIGTIMIVKEPYFKVMGDGEYGVRVDHVSDIEYLKTGDSRIPVAWQLGVIEVEKSSQALKIKGNQAMEQEKYWQAIHDYSDALDKPATAEEIAILKRNRSLAYFKTMQFDAALSETNYPTFDQDLTEKTMFRAAQALYNLDFSKCLDLLKQLCTSYPGNNEALLFLKRTEARVHEQTTGIYDFGRLQKEANKLRPPHLDHATYIGPVEIRQTETKGRSLFVTKSVKAGDLLLCEKAFAQAHANKDASDREQSSSRISLLINPETNKGFMGTQADLIKLVIQKLYRTPSVAPSFNALYHGKYKSVNRTTVDSKPIVDTFLVERIMSLNVFGCPISSLDPHIKATRLHNSPTTKSTGETTYDSCGIWTHASYINHNCYSNSRRSFIGDMMIVRASRDLEPGTEITFWYHNPDSANEKALQDKLNHWGFVCDCVICLDTKATSASVHRKRQNLIADLKKALNSSTLGRVQIERTERILHNLDETYIQPAQFVPRLLLWDPQLFLARIFAAQKVAKKSLEWAGKVLTSLGFVFVGLESTNIQFAIMKWGATIDHLVETFLIMGTAFMEMGAVESSKRADEYARTVYKILVGEDVSFDATYK